MTTPDNDRAEADLGDAVRSIRSTREDESPSLAEPIVTADTMESDSSDQEVARFNTESADVSDDELDQPDSRG